MLKRSTLPATERSPLKQLSNAHTIGQSKRGTADGVVCFIANLSTTSANSVAIIPDLIFIERLSPNNCSVVDISTNLSLSPQPMEVKDCLIDGIMDLEPALVFDH
ncbi:MAG UNVERIFIED_CONTAM: hypothetical protein LVR29_29030 [Microcystis novacekii LVE1205-3]|jgi:hypothetical protein